MMAFDRSIQVTSTICNVAVHRREHGDATIFVSRDNLAASTCKPVEETRSFRHAVDLNTTIQRTRFSTQ